MRLLDLYCGAGGAAEGYRRAGFDEILGIDIRPQKHYPFEFTQADALQFMSSPCSLAGFDAVHASPPCQRYSRITGSRKGGELKHPDLVDPTRKMLIASGLPYIIENVVGAPLIDPIMLCGWTFGFETYRHRLFEGSFPLTAPVHKRHETPASSAGNWKPGTFISIAGHFAPVAMGRTALDIDWMTQGELAESVPPYFTEYVGRQLLGQL